ncbi:uncharacterized protein LOC129267038 [Lytechinus pictus]|uniref:uncharacterized protein LOC129267038 n=1 Tax=Lytechinus pictus TaxID=7653 RepID=UPI0030B9E1BD
MPSAAPYVCTAILPMTTRGNATISVIVKSAPIITTTEFVVTTNATDLFTGDPGSRSLGKGVIAIIVITLLITILTISIIIFFIWRRRIKKSYELLIGDEKFIKGPVSYLELWELVGKCDLLVTEKIVNSLMGKPDTDSGFDVVRSQVDLYHELCRWKETTTGDYSILFRAIEEVGPNVELIIQDVHDRTSNEISLVDLEHICWHVRGCRETVKPILRALYPRHEGIPNCEEDSCDPGKPRNAEIKKDLQLMKAWKEYSMTTKPGYQEPKEDHKKGESVQMRQPTSRWIFCCHKQPKYRHGDEKNEQHPMFPAQPEVVELGVERSSPNQMIQLCLALERTGKDAHGPDKEVYILLAKTFFQIKDEYKRELDNEVIKELALSITKQHYQNLAKATRISADSIAKRNAEDLKAVFETGVMLEGWVQEQKGSNYEVRCRLRQAAGRCSRQDIADIFITKEQSELMAPITTHQASVTITNEQRKGDSETKREKSGNDTPQAQQSANYENLARGTKGMPRQEPSMPETTSAEKSVTDISIDELKRICRYGGREVLLAYLPEKFSDERCEELKGVKFSDHEISCILKPFIIKIDGTPLRFIKQLVQDKQTPRNILRQYLQEEAPDYACLLAKGREDKIFDVELVELAHRLVLSDVYPFAKALDISDEELTGYKRELGPKIVQQGTGKLLLEMKHADGPVTGIEERLKVVNDLKVAGYREEAKAIVFGFQISLADEAEIEKTRVDPAKLAKELGVSDDAKPMGPDEREESCQCVLQRWANIVRPSSFNHRMVLADALHNLGEKELALGIISGKFRNNVINSRVSKMLAQTIPEGIVDKLTRVLGKTLKKDLTPYDVINAWVTENKFFGFLRSPSPITLSNELLKAGFYPFAHEIMTGGWKGKEANTEEQIPEEAGDKNNDDILSSDVNPKQEDQDGLKEEETAKVGSQGEDVVSKKNDDNMTHDLKSTKEGPGESKTNEGANNSEEVGTTSPNAEGANVTDEKDTNSRKEDQETSSKDDKPNGQDEESIVDDWYLVSIEGDEQKDTKDKGIKENSQPSVSYSETLDPFGNPDDDLIASKARAMVHF